jgi:hypothetical protein
LWTWGVIIPTAVLLVAGCCGLGSLVLLRMSGMRVPGKPADTMALTTYKATMPKEVCTFTLDCQLDAATGDNYYHVNMTPVRQTFEFIEGYAPKDSAVGKKLFSLLEDGDRHILTVDVLYGEDNDAERTEILAVAK